MANVNSQLGLVITAKDDASAVFQEMAKIMKESLSSIMEDNTSLSSSLEEMANVATESTSKIIGSEEARRESLNTTTSDVVGSMAEQTTAVEEHTNVLATLAEKTTEALATASNAYKETSIAADESLANMTNKTEGAQAANNKWTNTILMSKDEIVAAFKEITTEVEEYGHLSELAYSSNTTAMKGLIETFYDLKVAIPGATQEQLDMEAALQATDKAQAAWRNTVVMTSDEVVDKFKQVISEHEELERLTGLLGTTSHSTMAKIIEDYENYRIKIVALKDDLNGQDEEISKITKSQQKWADTVFLTTDEMKSKFQELITVNEELAGAGRLLVDNDISGMRRLVSELSDVPVYYRNIQQAEEEAANASRELADASHQTSMSTALMDVGMYAQQAGEKITGFFEKAVTSGAEFEQKVDSVVATLNSKLDPQAKLSSTQIKALNDAALDMGKSGFFSANQISEGMYTLAQQGLNYKEIMGGAMTSVQDLAVATDSDLSSTANVVTDVMHEMGDSVKQEFGANLNDQFTGIANSISGAMHNARMSMDDFLGTMKYIGPQAGALNMKLTDVTTAIALFAEHGIRGSQAGTTLRRAITNLIPATDAGKKKLIDLGFAAKDGTNAFVDQSGQLKSLASIHDILHEKLGKLTQVQREQAINTIFGQYAMAGMTIYTNATSEKMGELTNQLYKNADAHKLAQEKWDNTAGAIRRVQAHFETIVKQIGADLAPTIDNLIQKGQGLLTWFDKMSPSTKLLIEKIVAITGVSLTFIGALGMFGAAVGIVSTGLSTLGLGLLAQKVAAMASSAATSVLTGAQWLFNAALDANPIGIVIIALAALGVAVYAIVKHWDQITDAISKAWHWLTQWNGTDAKSKTATVDMGKPSVGQNAEGTDNWKGGLTWVGEKGPELLNLPGGSQIMSNDKSMAYMKQGVNMGTSTMGGSNSHKNQTNNITVNVNGAGKSGQQLGNDIASALRLQMSMVSI